LSQVFGEHIPVAVQFVDGLTNAVQKLIQNLSIGFCLGTLSRSHIGSYYLLEGDADIPSQCDVYGAGLIWTSALAKIADITSLRVGTMRLLGNFTLRLDSKKEMPVEVLIDQENTIILIDCHCCEDSLSSRLPGGVLIPISSALKTFFGARKMRNLDVNVSGSVMRRTYKGLIENTQIEEMTLLLEDAVNKFTRKKKL
jgi:hypothetical protein